MNRLGPTLKYLPFMLMLCIIVAFSGCGKTADETVSEETEPTKQTTNKSKTPNPEKAIKEIYAGMTDRIGLTEASKSEMSEEIGLDPEDVEKAYIRYVDGDFGVSDVYIIKPKEEEIQDINDANQEESKTDDEDKEDDPEDKTKKDRTHKENVTNSLKERKDDRIREFSNYDIYNSTQISENAVIFERGDYVIMLMLEDNTTAREIIEKYIPEKLELS